MGALRPSFTAGVTAGLLAAIVIGVYLWQLWQPDRQVELHSRHLLEAVEQKDWSGIAAFVDASYEDQWGDDRTLLLTRLRQVLTYTRDLRLEPHDATAFSSNGRGEWRARITAS